ncbi:MAG: hypothetical protein P0116_00685 [Candidatus Nitrosocosmicus sp.]|nr:hypothetical protein [Candidatus Nitrosocosmicus sp.]
MLFLMAMQGIGLNDYKMRDNVIRWTPVAIDLSEPMDRILDKDEDLEYLEDYKFIVIHTLIGKTKDKCYSTCRC